MTLIASMHMVCTQYAQFSGLWIFHAVPWVGLQCVIVFPDHSFKIIVTYFSFTIIDKQY